MPLATLSRAVADRLRLEFTHPNPEARKAKNLKALVDRLRTSKRSEDRRKLGRFIGMLKAAEKASPVIATWRDEGGYLTLPRGGMARVRAVLLDADVHLRIVDERVEGDGMIDVAPLEQDVELWDFQEEMRDAGLVRENCLWRSPTGSGKTTAGIAFAAACEVPVLVVVWRGSLFDQWVKRCKKELGLEGDEIGAIRGQVRRLRQVTIGMQQTLVHCVDEIAPHFGCVICDEVDRFAAKTFLAVVDRLPARYRIGCAADERRKDGKQFLIYDVFGGVVAEVKRDELVRRKVVLDVEVRLVPTTFAPSWYLALPEQERPHAHNELLEAMTTDAERNALVTRLALDDVDAGEQVLAFSHRVEHCRQVEADVRALHVKRHGTARPATATGLLIGGAENESEFQRVVAGLESREVVFAAGTYQAIGYGLDLPSVARGVATTPIHNDRTGFNQVRGRLCRTSAATNKTEARLYYPWDVAIFGRRPLENLLRWNRRVFVFDQGGWVEGRTYLARMTDATNNEAPDPDKPTRRRRGAAAEAIVPGAPAVPEAPARARRPRGRRSCGG